MPVTARRVGFSTSNAMPVGRVDLDRVAVAQVELELRAHELGAIADAGDLEALAVARGDADDHVVDQRPGQAVQLARALVVVGALDAQHAVLADEAQLGRDVARELALGPLTTTWLPSIVMSTPAGTGMGSRPMRDMAAYQT